MTIGTLVAYLFGGEDAIFRIAETRRSLLLGLLIVLSAGFAREYDGEDLLREPWHLFLPLVASVVSSFLLYVLVTFVAFCRGNRDPFWKGYAIFLSLFWMTAPLAWLYAIPFERFMSAPNSVAANLWLLAIVAAWRVLLITRVFNVLYCVRWAAAFFVVMLFSVVVAGTAISLMPKPILSVMGGIRLTESENIILGTTFFVGFVCFVTAPIWAVGTIVVAAWRDRGSVAWKRIEFSASAEPPTVHRICWLMSAVALLVWVVVLPMTQPEQINRRFVESALKTNQIEEAIDYMSKRQPDDFPPHWDPPPRFGYGEETPVIWDVVESTQREGTASWVRALYIEKVLGQSHEAHYAIHRVIDLEKMDESQLEALLELLNEVDTRESVAAAFTHDIEELLNTASDGEDSLPLSDRKRELLEQLLELGPKSDVKESQALVPADDPAVPSNP